MVPEEGPPPGPPRRPAMRRIAVMGSSGSGKSTLARRLGEILGLPVVHMDALFWRPGWVEAPEEEWRALHDEAVRGDAWVIDGNYSRTLETRLARADTVVFLDLPRWRCLWRVLWRRVRYAGRVRPDIAPGCPEKVDWEFLSWIWRWHAESRPRHLATLGEHAREKDVVILRSPRDVRAFVAQVEREAGAAAGAHVRLEGPPGPW
ncbi:MAG TPA: DNA topology modulation protein [Dehalococcoidia bacterium]